MRSPGPGTRPAPALCATLLLAQACWCLTTTRQPVRPVQITPGSTTTTASPPPAPRCSDLGRTNTSIAVKLLREAMGQPRAVRDTALDAFIVVSTDEHQNEEPSDEDRRLEYISGWWGEGVAVILHFMPEVPRLPSGRIPGYTGPLALRINQSTTGSALWVPAGFFEQARRIIGCNWDVYDRDDPTSPSIAQWLSDRLAKEARIGADPRLVEYAVWQELAAQLDNYRLQLIHIPTLFDPVWDGDGRPQPSTRVTFLHDIENSGRHWLSKVTELRMEMRSLGADAMVVTALDEIAWLLNIRGKDLPYSPLFKCFLIVTYSELHLFIPQGKLNVDSRNSLGSNACFSANCTQVHEYSDIYMSLRTRAQPWRTVLIPSASNFHRGASEAIVQSVPEAKRFLRVSPVIYMKAKKNPVEVRNMVKAQIADGLAMCQLLEYFERTYKSGARWDEKRLSNETDTMRLAQLGNKGVARRTVAAFGANSAVPEYRATQFSNSRIFDNSTVLLSSGGQYVDGTAVVTRTLHLGRPSAEQRAAYTRVLQASIALSSLTWPESLPAAHLDVAARAPLWAKRKDYPHATGHGVGAFLNRREDPIKIDHNLVMNMDTLKEGYFVSVEPAWYESGKFGVRLGNVLEVIAAEGKGSTAGSGSTEPRYLAFRAATLVPYEPSLIHVPSLTVQEKQWLNNYQARVRSTLGPMLLAKGMTEAQEWMMKKTKPLTDPAPAKTTSASHALPVSISLLATAALLCLIY